MKENLFAGTFVYKNVANYYSREFSGCHDKKVKDVLGKY